MDGIQLTGLDGAPVAVGAQALQALEGGVRTPVLAPGAAGFERSTQIWNGMIRARPALAVTPCGVADVQACVAFAREHRALMSIKGGGHNVAGTALADGGLLLDLRRMRGVWVDPVARVARVQAGCLLGDVDRETQVHGLAAPLGFVSETGVAGLTLGGGFGYLSRRLGWTVDALAEVELVGPDGEVRRASATEHEDLFWALRGGGGNFGVATSFLFRLAPVGPRVIGGLVLYDAVHAPEVLRGFRELARGAPRELTLAATLRRAPPAPFLPKEVHGRPVIGVIACHSGDPAQARADLAGLEQLAPPLANLITEKPYCAQQRMLDATQPKGMHYYWKSEYLAEVPDELLAVVVARAAALQPSNCQLILFQLGGAIADRPADDGAVGNRDAAFVCNVAGSWAPDDPLAEQHLAWVRETWAAVRPFSTGGTYVNFQSADEGDDRVRAAYGANWERLAAVKERYDPENLFRINRNVRRAPSDG